MKSFRDPFEWGVKITNMKKSSGAEDIQDFLYWGKKKKKGQPLTGLVWNTKLPNIHVDSMLQKESNSFSTVCKVNN